MGPSASIISFSVFSGKFMCNTGVPGDTRTCLLLSRSVGFQVHGEPEPYQTIFCKSFLSVAQFDACARKNAILACVQHPPPLSNKIAPILFEVRAAVYRLTRFRISFVR